MISPVHALFRTHLVCCRLSDETDAVLLSFGCSIENALVPTLHSVLGAMDGTVDGTFVRVMLGYADGTSVKEGTILGEDDGIFVDLTTITGPRTSGVVDALFESAYASTESLFFPNNTPRITTNNRRRSKRRYSTRFLFR